MEEEIEFIKDTLKESVQKAIVHLEKTLMTIRAGKASPNMLAAVLVESYGATVPINQVAAITSIDSRTLSIQAWDKSVIPQIEKGILIANLGLTPMNTGENIIINIPPLTEQRRAELAKQVKAEGEEAKIVVRNARKEANNELKKLQKEGLSEDLVKKEEKTIQELIDQQIAKIGDVLAQKEQEIFKV